MASSGIIKIRRNDLCSCGSGKKYKECCLPKKMDNIADFSWRKLRQLEGRVIDKHLRPYLINHLPENTLIESWLDFIPAEGLPEDAYKMLQDNMFIPWMLFNWLADEDTTAASVLKGKTIAAKYLESHGYCLSADEHAFIEAMHKSYYSFYVVLEVKRDQELHIKDILLQTEHIVKEKLGTHFLQRGDVIFSRLITLNNQSICVGMGPFTIPSSYHTTLIDYRKQLESVNKRKKLTGNLLRNKDYAYALLAAFFDVIVELYEQPLRKFCNTDGDPLQFQKLYYKLINITPEEALTKLLPLTLEDNADEFLAGAKRDKKGRIIAIELPWLKKGNKRMAAWDNTIMGHLKLGTNQLIAEVNSARRAKKLQTLLKKYLGKWLDEPKMVIESLEKKLADDARSTQAHVLDEKEIEADPELQSYVEKMAQKHWASWLNERIPALHNQTPREAAKTTAGRELLEALLLHYERVSKQGSLLRPDVTALRHQLGL